MAKHLKWVLCMSEHYLAYFYMNSHSVVIQQNMPFVILEQVSLWWINIMTIVRIIMLL